MWYYLSFTIQKAERKAHNEALLALKCSQWDPSKDPKIVSEAFKTLFVGRLSYQTSEKTLWKEFETFGQIKSASFAVLTFRLELSRILLLESLEATHLLNIKMKTI